MTLLLGIAGSWLALSLLALVVTVGLCRSGHAEDVARGYTATSGAQDLDEGVDLAA